MTTNSKFSAIYHHVASMWHPNNLVLVKLVYIFAKIWIYGRIWRSWFCFNAKSGFVDSLDLITKWDRISVVANWTVSFALNDIEVTLVTPIFSPRIFDNPVLIAIWRCSISNHGYCMSNIIAETPTVLNNFNYLMLELLLLKPNYFKKQSSSSSFLLT